MNSPIPKSETAFYVFDIDRLLQRAAYLKKKLSERVELCYAVKANTFIIGEFIGKIGRFEVCSPGEAEICTALGVDDKDMVISGVYKTPSVIEKMVAEHDGRIYTVESLTQFEMLRSLSEKYDRVLPVLLRLTNDSQFGMDSGEIKSIIAERSKYKNLDIHGLQFFSGTQKTSLKKLKREVCKLDELLTFLREEYGFESKELEYGPGFPVAYFEGEDVNEEELLKGFSDIIDSMQNKVKIVLELGRSMAACCGSYYTHIVDIKHNKGQNYILIDGGMHHLVYFGQHMAMKQPIFSVCGKENKPNTAEWNICGSLCSMNDIVAKQVSLPDVSIGDLLCFENTGAYCMTECISLFLSREIPAVYLKKADEYQLVRKSFETSALNMPNIERK
ncbi:MAG: alanine racemase [Oscillospiraceae bacterium]|nr:alanine racemase [Oscillospiraceae bacterium]MDY5991099.1 alanine racemase [Oscillospiraceae bacterium]